MNATSTELMTGTRPGRSMEAAQHLEAPLSPVPFHKALASAFARLLTVPSLTGALLVGGMIFLAWASSYLSAVRMYQVDECQNLYMARIFSVGCASRFFTNASLFLVGPLSWITRSNLRAEQMFAAARLLFLVVFWINLFLLAKIAAPKLFSLKGLCALAGAATLAPLWDYGFEIRHDNLVLAGVLLTWWAIRSRPMGWFSYAFAGAVAVTALFIAVKAVVYVAPLSLAILAFPPPAFKRPRWHLVLAWACGFLAATGIIRICYGSSGGWESYLSVFHGVAKYSAKAAEHGHRLAPWFALSRLPGQTPLLLAIGFAALLAAVSEILRHGRRALTWEGDLPEALLLAGSLGALLINPTPFPYNLLHLVPYIFLLAFRFGARVWHSLVLNFSLASLTVAVLVFAHFVPFGYALRRHFDYSSVRQNSLIHMAEEMTDPALDQVYDGIGMVVTRDTIAYDWYLHSLNIASFKDGSGPTVRGMLKECPAAVVIPSYRTDWLPAQDHDFINSRYVSLADDFMVLGQKLPAGGGEVNIFHAGRYRVCAFKDSNILGSFQGGLKEMLQPRKPLVLKGELDGKDLPDAPVFLSVGKHQLKVNSSEPLALVWVGPHLDRPPRVGAGDHDKLFINWY